MKNYVKKMYDVAGNCINSFVMQCNTTTKKKTNEFICTKNK